MATSNEIVSEKAIPVTDKDKRPQFGNRLLTNNENVFQHNAWDDVVWDEALEEEAKKKVSENSQVFVEADLQRKYQHEASLFWDKFYDIHKNKFFKDRNWLFTEFPELAPNLKNVLERVYSSTKCNCEKTEDEKYHQETPSVEKNSTEKEFPGDTAKLRILEVGCGVGNTVFPILESNNDPETFVYCCDFSETAITLVKENLSYDESRCHAFICDISKDEWQTPFPEASLDIIIMIFVLSALHPLKMQNVANLVAKYLKPGGVLLFRDYGRYDMAQLRFKRGKCLSDNLYVRGDGTLVYFFTQEEIRELFTKSGLIEEQNLVDRRLQVNRGKMLKMYRIWIIGKYRKPVAL